MIKGKAVSWQCSQEMMKFKFILILFFLTSGHLFSQPFQVGRASITFIDSSRNNRNIPAEVYYPADMAGENVPISSVNNLKFPVLSFGHGFLMTWDSYMNIWDAVVPEGFIIVFPRTETGFTPSHNEFGKDLAFLLSEMVALGNDNTSFLFNRVDTMNCVMGHSMGGGAAFLAAEFSPIIKTIVTFAPAETNPSAIQAAANLNIPALIFAGSNDCVTPPLTNQKPIYDALQSECKSYISIIGGSHCQMADNNFFCSFGEGTCTPPPAISRAEQHTIINRYLLSWLNSQLKDDCFSGAQFDSLIISDSGISFQKSCELCNTNSILDNNSNISIEIFPNPFHDSIYFQCSIFANSEVGIDLYLLNGTKIHSQTFSNVQPDEKLRLEVNQHVASGIYLLKLTIDGQEIVRKIVKE